MKNIHCTFLIACINYAYQMSISISKHKMPWLYCYIRSEAKLFSEIKSNVRLQHGLLKRLIGVCVLLVTSAWDKICLQAQAFIEYMKGAWWWLFSCVVVVFSLSQTSILVSSKSVFILCWPGFSTINYNCNQESV